MRLIDADALYKHYQDMCMGIACNQCPFLDLQDGCKVENLIYNAPTIEAEPIKPGEWLIDMSGLPMCSKCGTLLDEFQKPSRFCPNCGARMDGVENV